MGRFLFSLVLQRRTLVISVMKLPVIDGSDQLQWPKLEYQVVFEVEVAVVVYMWRGIVLGSAAVATFG